MDIPAMAWRLFVTALVPAAIGQLARTLLLRFIPLDRFKTFLGVVAQLGILLIVFGASAKAGPRLADLGATNASALLLMSLACLTIHLAAAAVAYFGARAMGFADDDSTACLFSGSQKTLPIGLLIATDPTMLGSANVPLAAFPILIYHMLQLFGDTIIADRLRNRHIAADIKASNPASKEPSGAVTESSQESS